MGIVVAICMLLGLLVLSPLPFINLGQFRRVPKLVNTIGFVLLVAGLWNLFWFGLQNWQSFWGSAALVSGFFMIWSSFLVWVEWGGEVPLNYRVIQIAYSFIKPVRLLVIISLAVCFLLYSVTLIRLNLGLPIIY